MTTAITNRLNGTTHTERVRNGVQAHLYVRPDYTTLPLVRHEIADLTAQPADEQRDQTLLDIADYVLHHPQLTPAEKLAALGLAA